jgi:hypothetical protein
MNWRLFIVAAAFGLIETAHFGWNMLPQSDPELICDGITLVLYGLAFVARKRA